MRFNSIILYEGASQIDHAPIVAVLTNLIYPSKNIKTGDMIQSWIMRSDVHPQTAVRTGQDYSVCGDCRHRSNKKGKRTCYVNVFQAPSIIWRTYKAGKYPRPSLVEAQKLCAKKQVRIGSYGDPAAVPIEYWSAVLEKAKGWTGYTHQWDSPLGAPFKPYCMASVDTLEERAKAHANGWRTFYVHSVGEAMTFTKDIICPASAESDFSSQCVKCGLCRGALSKATASVTIEAHGKSKRYI